MSQTANGKKFVLKDGRIFEFPDDPDIGVYRDNKIEIAIEIKGGIDPAAVLERLGAAFKSLGRAKKSNPNAVTILIVQGISLTPQADIDLQANKQMIDYRYTIEDIVNKRGIFEAFFKELKI